MQTNVRDFGARGNGQDLDTTAIQTAIYACAQAGGGTVVIPAGHYVIGSLFLRDHITLYLDAGATLLGSQNADDYPVIEGRWEGLDQKVHAPLIAGSRLRNVAVIGRGTIDARGEPWWRRRRENTLDYPRPRLIGLADCEDVLIEGITLKNSPSWTIHPARCENVTVQKVTIINPPHSPNTDGINPDSCRNVHIANCHIDVGDDCITIKSGTEEAGRERLSPCENITITNCTMVHGHGGVVIGSEMSGDVRNVTISNCVFVGTDRGIRLKSRRGRGGIVEDIRVNNLVMERVLCPFIMNLYYGPGAWGAARILDKNAYPVDEGTPRFRRIHFSHVTARLVQYAAAFIYGLAEMPVEEVSFHDVAVSLDPEAEAGVPAMAPGIEPMQRAGFWIRNARGLRLHNVEVTGQVGPAISLQDAEEIEISACTSRTPNGPVIQMQDVQGAFIHGCQAVSDTEVFLAVEGARTHDIVLVADHLSRAKQKVYLGADTHSGAVTLN